MLNPEDPRQDLLRELVDFLSSDGDRSMSIPHREGITSAEHLRREYLYLNKIVFDQLDSDTHLDRRCAELLSHFFAVVMSRMTEELLRDSDVKKAKNELRWFEQALDRVPKALFLLDLETKQVVFSNRVAQQMLGLEYVGSERLKVYGRAFNVYSPDGRLLAPHEIPSSRVLNGERLEGEEVILTAGDTRYQLKCYSEEMPHVEGRHHSALLLLLDITEQKKIEAELRETQKNLNEAIAISNIGFWQREMPGSHLTVTPILLKQFGIAPENFKNSFEQTFAAVHPGDRAMVTAAIEHAIQNKLPFSIEHRIVLPSGEIRWIAAKGEATYDAEGNPRRFTGTTLDVTEEKRQQAELHEARRLAENANTAKSQFLANMSHEIRTPLGAIMGFTSLLKEESLSRDDQQSFVTVIERNSAQLLRIIDDILDLSKVEAGMMLIEKIEFSLPELLAEFAALMSFHAHEKSVDFTTRLITDLPAAIKSDPTRIRQILMNVVGNAIKFTDRGSVEMHLSYQDQELTIEVQDTGRGISPEQAKNLFQPFAQADSSMSRKYGGTGLGLVLSRKLAETIGGSFYLKESEFGKGSTFVIRLNVEVKAGVDMVNNISFTAGPRTAPRAGCSLNDSRILLVEDSPDNQALISIFLEKGGARVDLADNGDEGYRKALKGDYDLVLMDVQMPVMDGIVAVRKLRKEGYIKPVIALTAHAMKEERVRCMNAGFTDFLSKPIQRDDLIRVMRQHWHH